MTDNELKELVAGLAIAQQETDRQLKARQLETERQLKASQLETDRQLKELRTQIGGLGNKFGTFTEGMAFPAMEKILRQEFGLERIAVNVKSVRGEQTLEIDVLGYNNGETNQVVVVEVKSHLRPRDIDQVLQMLQDFPHFFPEHADKKLYGMIAAVAITKETRQRVFEEGLYLGMIHDEQFKLAKSKHFAPKCFQQPLTT
jgi:RecB family endonuclease NucS